MYCVVEMSIEVSMLSSWLWPILACRVSLRSQSGLLAARLTELIC